MDIKSFIRNRAEKEKKNHYIVNIMMTALFSLIIIFTLFSGTNINLGSVTKDDGGNAVVRHSLFQITDAVFSSNMDYDESKDYVDKVNKTLWDDYGVLGANYDFGNNAETEYEGLNLTRIITDAKAAMGKDVKKVNWLKYKFALSNVLADLNLDAHKSSWDGHAAVMLVGQSVFIVLIKFALIIISIVMLIYSILALVKKKPFTKAKLSILLLLICALTRLFFNFGLISIDFSAVFVIILTVLVAGVYAFIQHAMMEKRYFSRTMFIHNAALLGFTVLSFILMLCPLFKVTDSFGVSHNYGWRLIFDLFLGEGAYMTVPMAYFLQVLLIAMILMMHTVLNMVLILMLANRFLSADYQHNEKKMFITMTLIVNLLIYLLIGAGSASGKLVKTSLDLTAAVNIGLLIIQPLVLAGALVFEYLYKPSPIKKELIIAPAPAAPAPAAPAPASAPVAPAPAPTPAPKANKTKK